MFLSGGVQMSVEKRRRYDREFKLEAVRLSLEPGRSVAGAAAIWEKRSTEVATPRLSNG
jgi:transposase-like protein